MAGRVFFTRFKKKGAIGMKLLLADPDRDLLKAYHKLLTGRGYDVSVCFEGTETVRMLGLGQFDLLIVNETLPLVPCERIVTLAGETNVPVIMLLRRKVSAGLLMGPIPANAYLPFPFLPEELVGLIAPPKVLAHDTQPIVCGDVTAVPARFRIENTELRLTAGEISLLRTLSEGAAPAIGAIVPCVNALNAKFALAGKTTRIVYQTKEGYRLVT